MKEILFVLLLFPALFVYGQETKLKLASDVWPPFTDKKSEESLAFDIVEKAFERIDIETKFVITDFKDVLPDIKKGRFEGSSALWKNEEREEFLIFSDAYLNNQLILLGRKGSHVNIKSFAELEGKKIGLVKEYAYGESLTTVPNLEITYSKSDQENLEHLISEGVDFILVDAILIEYMLDYQVNDVRRLLEFAQEPLITHSLHVALNKTVPEAENIIRKLNKEFKTMITDGSYNEILHLDWIRADVDGDGDLELVFTGEKLGTSEPDRAYSVESEAHITEQTVYYVNGVRYESWDEVPEKYKVETPKTKFIPTGNFGIILNF